VANPATPNRDILAFDGVGNMGLGDIDLNDAQDTLFAVNLFNRTIVRIRIGNPETWPIPTSQVSEVPIPKPGCSANVDWRPWGLKHKDGVLYVGGVCSAESTQNVQDMRAFVCK
jgi:hypothetical protein